MSLYFFLKECAYLTASENFSDGSRGNFFPESELFIIYSLDLCFFLGFSFSTSLPEEVYARETFSSA